MQKEINDEIWENKDIRSARMNAVNGARDLVAAFTNAGFYKTKEEAFDDFHAFKNMVFDYIYADMKPHVNTEFHTMTDKGNGGATDKQIKAVFAIVWGTSGNPDLAKELTVTRETLNDLSFSEASDFIDKYGRKHE